MEKICVAGVMGGNGGVFVDRGLIEDIDKVKFNGSNKTNTLYEGVYSFVANRIVLQFRLSPKGVLEVRRNNDYLYNSWSEWKTLITL